MNILASVSIVLSRVVLLSAFITHLPAYTAPTSSIRFTGLVTGGPAVIESVRATDWITYTSCVTWMHACNAC